MIFTWDYPDTEPQILRRYIRRLKISRSLLRLAKAEGDLLINGQSVTVRAMIQAGDQFSLVLPDERGHDTVIPIDHPLDIVYEDDHLLVLNKPAGLISIPSKKVPDRSIANWIKGYLVAQNYADQVVHIATRLDRDTTGLVLVAKHALCHSMLSLQIEDRSMVKHYLALSSRVDWPDHGLIDQAIARCGDSIITRQVHPDGQEALSEYWLVEKFDSGALLKLQLHTGRTHQLRVHLAHEGGPLIGDDLYGGPLDPIINHQALHCHELIFTHPFTHERMQLKIDLPADMATWVDHHRIK